MAQSVHQRAGDGLGVRAGAFECPLDPRLQCSLRDALIVTPHEERGACRPPRQIESYCCSAILSLGKAGGAAVEVGLDDREKFGFNGNAAFFAAFSFDVNDRGAVVGGADVTDVCLTEFLGAQSGQQRGEDDREIPFGPVGSAFRVAVLCNGLQQYFDGGAGRALGRLLASLGRPTNCMGLAASCSPV